VEQKGTDNEIIPLIIAMDCLSSGNKDVKKYHIDIRLKEAANVIHITASAVKPSFKLNFDIQVPYKAGEVLQIFEKLPELKYKVEGLFFTPAKPYKLGLNDKLFKWKSPEENTVDFLLRIIEDDNMKRYSLEVQDGPSTKHYDWFTSKSGQNIESGAVIECYWNTEGITLVPDPKDKWTKPLERKGCWELKRIRTDKKQPYTEHIVIKDEEIRKNPITKQDLILLFQELQKKRC